MPDATPAWVHALPHFNASLNLLATALLVLGLVLIKRRREAAHKWTMIGCFGVSAVFLIGYLVHKSYVGARAFPTDPAALWWTYIVILVSHSVLAASVPFLAIATIYLGLRDRRAAHVRLARWTFPIWLYVSVTGVVVYLLLYQLVPAG